MKNTKNYQLVAAFIKKRQKNYIYLYELAKEW